MFVAPPIATIDTPSAARSRPLRSASASSAYLSLIPATSTMAARFRDAAVLCKAVDMLDIAPLTATIGAEIHGVDLADDLDDTVIEEIREALLEWKVVFFRDQQRLDRTSHV